MTNAADVVIWSADVDESTLERMLVGGLPLRYIKLDRLALTRTGLYKIRELRVRGFQVFADAKIDDIPDKLVELTQEHLRYRPWMLNCMASCCSTGHMVHQDPKQVDGLKRFADLCHDAGTRPCAVTVLTSKTDDMAVQEYDHTAVEQVLFYVDLLFRAGFTDLVCSPREAEAIRAEPRFNSLDINTPGVRLPGSDPGDQARITTPAAAIAAGATRLVIGRDLTKGDFAANWQRIVDNLSEGE